MSISFFLNDLVGHSADRGEDQTAKLNGTNIYGFIVYD